MIQQIKKNKLMFVSICILFLYFVFYWFEVVHPIQTVEIGNKFSNTYLWWDNFHSVGEILPGVEVLQDYKTTETCSGIQLRFTTLGHNVKGSIQIKVWDEGGKEYLNTSFDAKEIQDGEFRYFNFDENCYANKKNSRKLMILIKAENCEKGNAVSVERSNEDSYANAQLFINGELVEGDLIMGFSTIQDCNYIKVIYLALCFGLTVFLVIVFHLIHCLKIEKVVFISILVLGILSDLINPHKSISDEDAHFHTAYRWSNVLLMKENTTNTTERISSFLIREGDKRHSLVERPTLETYASIKQNFKLFYSEEDSKPSFAPGRNVTHGIFPYFISAVTISVCRILNIGLYPMLFFARFFNLLFFAGLIYYSIKIIPFGKEILASLAILPMSIQQMASFSPDGFLIAIVFFVFSYVTYLIYEKEKIGKKDIFIIYTIFYIYPSCKLVYSLLILLFWMIPAEKFNGRNKKVYFNVILILIMVLGILINSNIITRLFTESYESTSEVKTYGISYIFKNPITTITIILRTILTFGGEYIREALGGSLQWSSININFIWLSVILICIVGTSYLSGANRKKNYYINKIVYVGMFFAIFFTIEIVFFALSTPNTNTTVAGVAGRYLVPIFPLLFSGMIEKEEFIEEQESIKIKKSLYLIQLLMEELVLLYVFVAIVSR